MSRSYQYSPNQDVASNDLFSYRGSHDPEMHADLDRKDRYPSVPGSKKDGTSAIAAETVKAKAIPVRQRILEVLRFGDGLTPDEIANLIGRSILSVRPRCSELIALGKVKPTGQRRKNASGLLADVLKAI